jgi:hypothetical protein
VPTILDQNFSVGVESTYGTTVAPTRAYEAQADDWAVTREDIPSVGMRPGLQGEFTDRQKTVVMGAEGTTTLHVLDRGLGLLLRGMLGVSSGPTQQGSTVAYLQTFTTSTASPAVHYTAQMQRVDSSDTTRAFTYPGATITEWTLSHEVGGLLELELGWDARTELTSVAAGAAVSPASAATFDWTELGVTVAGSEVCVTSVELNGVLGLKTDRRLMCATSGGLKRAPKRAAVPTITGTIQAEFEDLALYNRWVNNEIFAVVMTWTGAQIVSPHNFRLQVTLPACKFTGSTPVSSLTDLTTQPLPFKALFNGSDPMCTITYVSTDTAF